MELAGIIRRVDDLGRIVLPAELRRALDISERDEIEIRLGNDEIVIRKHEPCCIFCGSNQALILYEGKSVCKTCLQRLEQQAPV